MIRPRARAVAHALTAAVLLCGALATFTAFAAGRAPDPKRMDRMARELAKVQQAAADDYLSGDPARALDRLNAVVDGRDWQALLALGNMTWTLHPEESLRWHTQAYALSKHNDHVLLELAYHYTRRGECEQAVDAWARIDKAGLLGSYMPMLAGYCHLQLGNDPQAFAMFKRAEPGRHGRFEYVLSELWGRRPALGEHAEHLQALKATGALASLHAGMENALRFGEGEQRGKAMLALSAAAATHAGRVGAVAAQLECLRPAFAQEAVPAPAEDGNAAFDAARWEAARQAREQHDAAIEAAWRQRLDACKLLLGAHPMPADPGLARWLVANAMGMKLATSKELLATHGAALAARARSATGDLEALRILAALQSDAQDPALTDTDELGWSRYADPKFAASRVVGQLLKDGKPTPQGLALLERAHAQFPDDQVLLGLWLRHANPPKDAATRGWRTLALLEFKRPSASGLFHAGPSAATLYQALGQYREAAGL